MNPGCEKPHRKQFKGKEKPTLVSLSICPGCGAWFFYFYWGTSWSSPRIKEITFQTQVLRFLILELFIASIGPSCTLK